MVYRLLQAAAEARFILRGTFWLQAWSFGAASAEEMPEDVRRALDRSGYLCHNHSGDAGDRYDLELDVGVPDGEGETWAEAAERLRRSGGESA